MIIIMLMIMMENSKKDLPIGKGRVGLSAEVLSMTAARRILPRTHTLLGRLVSMSKTNPTATKMIIIMTKQKAERMHKTNECKGENGTRHFCNHQIV